MCARNKNVIRVVCAAMMAARQSVSVRQLSTAFNTATIDQSVALMAAGTRVTANYIALHV